MGVEPVDRVNRVSGSAADFHARELPDAAAVWQFEISRPAVVLGSRQTVDVLDTDACRRRHVEIVRRRSGGGAVLLVAGATEWIDVVIPAGDDQWDDDVPRSMVHLGERWVEALRDVVDGELTVHRGPMTRTAWSDLACFAGIAPGEVLLDGAKLVGLSQRRTRRAARFQCAVNRRFDGELLLELLAAPPPTPHPPVALLPPTATDVAVRLLHALGWSHPA